MNLTMPPKNTQNTIIKPLVDAWDVNWDNTNNNNNNIQQQQQQKRNSLGLTQSKTQSTDSLFSGDDMEAIKNMNNPQQLQQKQQQTRQQMCGYGNCISIAFHYMLFNSCARSVYSLCFFRIYTWFR